MNNGYVKHTTAIRCFSFNRSAVPWNINSNPWVWEKEAVVGFLNTFWMVEGCCCGNSDPP